MTVQQVTECFSEEVRLELIVSGESESAGRRIVVWGQETRVPHPATSHR